MKKILLTAICGWLFATGNAQNSISDTVTTGASYASQVWYSLETGHSTETVKNSWDIAFRRGDVMSATIIINDGSGTRLWKYPGDTSAWNTLDASGMNAWPEAYNAGTEWETGAFNAIPGSSSFGRGYAGY